MFEKLKSSGIWQSLEIVVTVIAQFFYLAIMARILSKPDFGLMAIANSFVSFGHIFAESGMGAALIQRKIITNKHINAALQGGILFGIILFFIFFLTASPISGLFPNLRFESLLYTKIDEKSIDADRQIKNIAGCPFMVKSKEIE